MEGCHCGPLVSPWDPRAKWVCMFEGIRVHWINFWSWFQSSLRSRSINLNLKVKGGGTYLNRTYPLVCASLYVFPWHWTLLLEEGGGYSKREKIDLIMCIVCFDHLFEADLKSWTICTIQDKDGIAYLLKSRVSWSVPAPKKYRGTCDKDNFLTNDTGAWQVEFAKREDRKEGR